MERASITQIAQRVATFKLVERVTTPFFARNRKTTVAERALK